MLVWHDLLGLTPGHVPKFVKQYADLGHDILKALEAYVADVRAGRFPDAQHTYPMPDDERELFEAELAAAGRRKGQPMNDPSFGVRGGVLAGRLTIARSRAQSGAPRNATLTAVPGIKVGHYTLTERPTGCTVMLAEAGATAGVDVRGAAPATRETDLLNPVNIVQQVHAIVLSGGSAFGLDTASGVMKYLEEKKIGFAFGRRTCRSCRPRRCSISAVGDARIRPTADCGYQAAKAATDAPVAEGSVGAGAGATLGKTGGADRAMKGGIGSAAITMPDGLIVAALVAVNAAGDVIDPATGRVVAGVRTADGKGFADARVLLRAGGQPPAGGAGENTTLGVIATNAVLTKTQATRVAQMAHDGFARAISPEPHAGRRRHDLRARHRRESRRRRRQPHRRAGGRRDGRGHRPRRASGDGRSGLPAARDLKTVNLGQRAITYDTTFRIAVIAGDGIGREVIPAGIAALEAATRGSGVDALVHRAALGLRATTRGTAG